MKIAGGRIKGVDLLATAAGLAGLGAVATGPAPGTDNATPAKKPQKEDPLREVEGLFRKILPGK